MIFKFALGGIILGILITLIAEIDVTKDIMRPIGIVMIAGVVSIIPSFFLDGYVRMIVSITIYLTAIYFLLDFFYSLVGEKKKKIMISFSAIYLSWVAFWNIAPIVFA